MFGSTSPRQLSAAISIILPIYNTEPYLCRCLDSIRAQTFAEWECICIDDGSTDGSSAILTEYTAKDSRFTVIHQKNRGPAAARNTGFTRVRGEYFICMDSDDWAEPDYLERLYAAAKQADADIAVCDAVITLKKETIIRRFPITDMPDPVCSLLSNEVCGWLWFKLFRTELFAAHGITWIEGLDMMEDALISVKAFYFAKKTAYVDKALYHYNCTNEQSISTRLSDDRIRQMTANMELVEQFLAEQHCLERYKAVLIQRYADSKLRIINGDTKLRKAHLEMYNNKKLYTAADLSVLARILFLCCYCHLFFAARVLIFAHRRFIRFRNAIMHRTE